MKRSEFISIFAENIGIEPDVITDIIFDLDALNGVSADMQEDKLVVSVSAAESISIPVIYFACNEKGTSVIYVRPDATKRAMTASGRFPVESVDFFKTLDLYSDKYSVHPISDFFANNPKLYLDVTSILENQAGIVSAFDSLAKSLL